MTQIVQESAVSPATSAPAEPPTAPIDVQRQSLDQLVRLSVECTAEEERLELQRSEAAALEEAEFQKTVRAAQQRQKRLQGELAQSATQRREQIEAKYASDRQATEQAFQNAQQVLARKKEETESTLKKQMEQAAWQAESGLVAIQMRVDGDENAWKKEEQASQAELAGLDKLKTLANECLGRYRMEPVAVDDPADDAIKQRIAAERLAVLAEYRQQSVQLSQQLDSLTQPRAMDDFAPLFLVVALAGVCGAGGWIFTQDAQSRLAVTTGAAVGALVLGVIGFLIYRSRRRAKIKARAGEMYQSFLKAHAVACRAAKVDSEAAAAAREKRVLDARAKRDQDVATAKEKTKALLVKAQEQLRATLAEQTQKYKDRLAGAEEEQKRALEELEESRQKKSGQIDQEDAATRGEAQSKHTRDTEAIASEYEQGDKALWAKWNNGLRAVTDLMALGGGIDPQLIDWNSPAWDEWKSSRDYTGRIRFGDMKVNLAELTEKIPKRLKLPESFSVPALMTFPSNGSLLIETDHAGRQAAVDAAQMVMARLLTQLPAGRVKFTIFDPVGLGQSFAGFMHLVDHDESLVGSRIWTDREHMKQRLTDLTEHMETVIQKYLRNEYATIDQYNAQAGELAEPIRFLVIADFPTAFEPEALRRLASIALTGPRCGVYSIIIRDIRQPLPQGTRMEELVSRSVHLAYKNGTFTWNDSVFKRFPLRVDAPPDEKALTRLMDLVGHAAKDAKRVEVPFQSIAPPADQFWSLSSQADLRVPIGKSGATRLQSLRLGVGVAQHTLIAGKTGSGKSNLMHTVVTNLAMWYGPDEVEFYLIDFKKGVEFKAYVTSQLPHARAIAVESDREFGLSVLQRVDAELSRRGAMFRDIGVQDINAYREKTKRKLPRTILLIDEFQEFFTEDDKLSQEAAGLMDRLVRQGRAFGVHLVLGSQTIGGSGGLGRSTLGQIAVRVALQCTEADSQMILGDNNSAARLLTRPGEAIYNDQGGLVEANSPFQIAFLPDEGRERYLEKIRLLNESKPADRPLPIVFEGNSAAVIRKNQRLMALLEQPAFPPPASIVPAFIGEPVAIKDPTAVSFRRQGGANVLVVGQDDESAIGIFASCIASIAAQQKPGEAIFYLMDGTATDSRYFGLLEKVLAAVPQESKVVAWRQVPEAINEIAQVFAQRQGNDGQAGPSIYLLLFGLQRYRLLRKQEDDFSFSSRGDEPPAPKPEKQFAEILGEGPALGIHTMVWADTPITVERTLDRSLMRQFDYRVLFQMSSSDSSNLIDSPLANRLGAHRALMYSEEQGTAEKFRPYEVPTDAWLEFIAAQLKKRPK